MKKLTSRINIIALTILAAACFTACDVKNTDRTIPVGNQIEIADAIKTLNVSMDDFTAFLDNMNTDYDSYISEITKSSTLEEAKSDIEKNFDCTYNEYINAVITVNNKTTPDSDKYALFKSKYSLYDTYIPLTELNDDKTSLKDYDIAVEVADESETAYAFDAIAYANCNFKDYISFLNQEYECTSAEFTNVAIFGGHGVTKPSGDNKCIDNLFVFDDKTNEILEKISMPVLTLKNEDENKNITLALCNELGLAFKTTGKDSYKKMLKIGNVDFQIRNTETSADKTD